MKFVANKGKKVEIQVQNETYLRHAVKTRFITPDDDHIEILKEYVGDLYREGDIVSISEKIVSICQNRIVRREDIKVGSWAIFLSKFACPKNRGGYGVGMPINMQYAIDRVGLLKVLVAGIAGGLTKLFGIKGVFYAIVGREVSGLDGFYDGAWKEYADIGIEIPQDPVKVCNEIKDSLGISCMIVDSNDFGQVILGKSYDIKISDRILRQMIKDNPAGQGQQMTPIILIRKKTTNNARSKRTLSKECGG